jgi:hypothetical protein
MCRKKINLGIWCCLVLFDDLARNCDFKGIVDKLFFCSFFILELVNGIFGTSSILSCSFFHCQKKNQKRLV